MKNILISLILICLFTISAQAQWWEKTTGPREYLYKAYDTKRGKIVGVSERGETWEFSGIAWSLVQKSSPFLVWWNYAAYGGMAYDEARDRMVLYLRNDGNPLILKTYEWDGKIWQLKNKRIFKYWSFGEPIYDRDRKKVIFITSNGYQTKKQHTWAWNGNSWQMLKIANPKKK